MVLILGPLDQFKCEDAFLRGVGYVMKFIWLNLCDLFRQSIFECKSHLIISSKSLLQKLFSTFSFDCLHQVIIENTEISFGNLVAYSNQ